MFVLVPNFRSTLQSFIHWIVSIARVTLFRGGEIPGVRLSQVQGGDGDVSRLVRKVCLVRPSWVLLQSNTKVSIQTYPGFLSSNFLGSS